MKYDGIQPIRIKDIRGLNSAKLLHVQSTIQGINSLDFVKGTLKLEYEYRKLIIKAELKTTVKLQCDKCLKTYNHSLQAQVEEHIKITEKEAGQKEVNNNLDEEDLIENIDISGFFDTEKWIFEQLHLQIPVVKVCGKDCSGYSSLLQNKEESEENSSNINQAQIKDPRLMALKKLLYS